MADRVRDSSGSVAFQRHVTTLLLDHISTMGFALAGSGAIREHGITQRPTNDIDLFTTAATGPEAFTTAVEVGERTLRDHGYKVSRTRSTPEFARLLVEATGETEINDVVMGMAVEVDLGIDWRREPPAQLSIGPVLGLRDAVGSKVAAVYSRGEARDYLDVDAIRESRRFTDSELLTLAQEHDPGFEVEMFVQQLRRVRELDPVETTEYGTDAERLDQIKLRLGTWAVELLESLPLAPPASRPPTSRLAEHRPPSPGADGPGRNRDTDPRGPSL